LAVGQFLVFCAVCAVSMLKEDSDGVMQLTESWVTVIVFGRILVAVGHSGTEVVQRMAMCEFKLRCLFNFAKLDVTKHFCAFCCSMVMPWLTQYYGVVGFQFVLLLGSLIPMWAGWVLNTEIADANAEEQQGTPEQNPSGGGAADVEQRLGRVVVGVLFLFIVFVHGTTAAITSTVTKMLVDVLAVPPVEAAHYVATGQLLLLLPFMLVACSGTVQRLLNKNRVSSCAVLMIVCWLMSLSSMLLLRNVLAGECKWAQLAVGLDVSAVALGPVLLSAIVSMFPIFESHRCYWHGLVFGVTQLAEALWLQWLVSHKAAEGWDGPIMMVSQCIELFGAGTLFACALCSIAPSQKRAVVEPRALQHGSEPLLH